MNDPLRWTAVAAALLLSACQTVPTGPNVMVLPGTGKTFDQFQMDDHLCRQFASQQIGTTQQKAAAESGVSTAAIATGVGAAAGALLGGNSQSAAQGAGAGLIVGSAAGAGSAQSSADTLQHRYDIAYQQCMYAKGNQIPVQGTFAPQHRHSEYAPPPPPPPSTPPAGNTY
jgi:hypothetical protein